MFLAATRFPTALTRPVRKRPRRRWLAYYRWTAKRPPRELLLQALNHIEWEGGPPRRARAVEIGFGAGNDTLELLRRGWNVVAIDAEKDAANFLARRVPPRSRARLTTLVTPMEGLSVPAADFVYASFSLPFCSPDRFPELWTSIRSAVRPGGHFAGQFFGDQDGWNGEREMSFHGRRAVLDLARGWKVELVRETVEEGRSFESTKHWHYFDVIFERPRSSGSRSGVKG